MDRYGLLKHPLAHCSKSDASGLYLSYATIRERYALLRGSQWTTEEDSLYFSFRQYLNYSINDLAFFDPYVNYVLNYINKETVAHGSSYFQIKQTTDFNIKRLEVLDKNIGGTLLRNNLARAIAFEEILTFENHGQHERFLQFYATVNSSLPFTWQRCWTYTTTLTLWSLKSRCQKFGFKTQARDTVNSASLTNGQKTVFYFWSQTQMNHYRTSLERVAKFKANFPDIRFIGICIQPFNTMVDEVQKIMEVDKENQYALIDFENASKAWVLTLLNKAIIIDEKAD